jgi:hypothetical protein
MEVLQINTLRSQSMNTPFHGEESKNKFQAEAILQFSHVFT